VAKPFYPKRPVGNIQSKHESKALMFRQYCNW
jgi:hypothetical protein